MAHMTKFFRVHLKSPEALCKANQEEDNDNNDEGWVLSHPNASSIFRPRGPNHIEANQDDASHGKQSGAKMITVSKDVPNVTDSSESSDAKVLRWKSRLSLSSVPSMDTEGSQMALSLSVNLL